MIVGCCLCNTHNSKIHNNLAIKIHETKSSPHQQRQENYPQNLRKFYD